MQPWRHVRNQNGEFKHTARALLGAMSIVMINNVVGPIETSGILEVTKQWMSRLNRFLVGISDYKF
jgi:hypothetical protein